MLKISNFCLVFFIMFVIIYPISAFAEPTITLNKKSYETNDTIKVSGKVDFQDNVPLVIQIRSISDIVAIEQFFPSKSGSYSSSFDISGPKWIQSGEYAIIVSYNGEKSQKTFNFSINEGFEKNPLTEPKSIKEKEEIQKPKPKISLAGFPDPNFSPNYYINLYNTEADFKKLFDITFPEYPIQSIAYNPTHVSGFPDNDLSPQYYVDRYYNEPRFRMWFESQFTENTIFDIVGLSENTRSSIPNWMKQYVELWSLGKITDSQFASGITEMIQRKILIVSDDIVKTKNSDGNIPSWFTNTAKWYSDGRITENDFLFGLQYLIEKEIIVIV